MAGSLTGAVFFKKVTKKKVNTYRYINYKCVGWV